MRWLSRLCSALLRLVYGRRGILKAAHVSELPNQLDDRRIYLVGEGEHLWVAAFVCPCGCGEAVQLNLVPESRPRWTIREHGDGAVTLSPSVWRVRGCRSHFFIRQGRVEWC